MIEPDRPDWLSQLSTTSPHLSKARKLWRFAEFGLVAPDPDVRDTAVTILRWFDGRASESLDAALGLSGGGRAALNQQMRLIDRDVALRRLTGIDPFDGMEAATAARLIVQKWLRYETAAWPRHKHSGEAPAAQPEATFFALLTAGHQVLSANYLARILRREVDAHGAIDPIEIPVSDRHGGQGKETET